MEDSPRFAVNEMYLYTRYWKKVIILGLIVNLLLFIYTLVILPNVDMTAIETYLNDPTSEIPDIPASYSIVSILIFAFGIIFIWNYLKMFRILHIAQRSSAHPQLRRAFLFNLSYLTIFIFEIFFSWFVILILLEIIAKILIIFHIVALRQYSLNFADHTPNPNQSEPVDKAVQLYIIIASAGIIFYLIGTLLSEPFSSGIFLFGGILMVNLSTYNVAVRIGKLLQEYADQRVSTRSIFRQFTNSNVSQQSYEENHQGPSGIPYPTYQDKPSQNFQSPSNPHSSFVDGPQIPSDDSFSYDQWSHISQPSTQAPKHTEIDADFRRCPQCDAKIPKDANVCGFCGAIF